VTDLNISKNPEVKRVVIIFVVLLVVFLVLAVVMSCISMMYYRHTTALNHAAVVGAVAQRYPEAETDIINQIQNWDEDALLKGREILEMYGMHNTGTLTDSPLLQRNFWINTLLYLLLAAVICGIFVLFFMRFLKGQYGQIQHLAHYARKVGSGDYSLDIRDNDEGDISILKNEIYKITTMLKEQAQVLNRDKAVLADSLADISHQLKTPMTSISVLNDLLYVAPSQKVRQQFLDRMRSQLKRMEWLITSLLKLSRLDAGAITMRRDEIIVKDLVDRAVASMAVPLDIKMQEVRVKGPADTKYIGDFNWTCEALINILKNCIEHTPEGGVIDIYFEQNPIFTMVKISDTGIGIDKEDIPHIFNRFYKGKNAAEDSVGIGLAMARAIIDKQGGDITVSGEKGSGAEFTIKFYKGVM
jgi:signal transduction histidine kinase